MTARRALPPGLLVMLIAWLPAMSVAQDAPKRTPTFRSAVDLVSVAAVVRDRHGRFARDLHKEDFIVDEGGSRRDIQQFQADDNAPVRLAMLFDVSGSMRLSSGIENSRQAARQLLASLRLGRDGTDEAAVFSFDIELQSLQPFTADAAAIESAFSRVAPYGQTSLYDAIAQTARQVAETPAGDRHRRAVVVFTDGVDTSSEMQPAQVSAIASAIDVPVYIVTVVASIDRPEDVDRHGPPATALRNLARMTGGDLFVTSAPAHESSAARQIVDELRHQYVLAFSASPAGGWHALDIKVRDRDLTVRARSGYAAAGGADSDHTFNGQGSPTRNPTATTADRGDLR